MHSKLLNEQNQPALPFFDPEKATLVDLPSISCGLTYKWPHQEQSLINESPLSREEGIAKCLQVGRVVPVDANNPAIFQSLAALLGD